MTRFKMPETPRIGLSAKQVWLVRNLQKNTPESFKLRLSAMDKAKAEAAREAMLGRLQEKTGDYLNKNPSQGVRYP
jgi:hypothetical protein